MNGDSVPDYLQVLGVSQSEVFVYELLTPDGDGYNDVLIIENIESYPQNTMQIFNRWGVLVWKEKGYDPDNNYFEGRSNGRVVVSGDDLLPTGTYFYVLEYLDEEQNKLVKKAGYIYINR